MSRHGNGGVALESVFAFPKNGGCLQTDEIHSRFTLESFKDDPHLILSIEVDPTPSVERYVSKRTSLVPAPREHGEWYRNGNVDSDLPHVHFPLVFSSSSARLSEDGGSVTIFILVDDLEGLIESLGVQDDKDGSEDLFVVTFHCGVCFDDGRSDEISVRISFHLDVAPIQEDLSAFRLSGADEPNDTLSGSGGDYRAPVQAWMSNESARIGNRTCKSVSGSNPPLTRSFDARSMRPGRNSLASPTRTTTEIAMHR